ADHDLRAEPRLLVAVAGLGAAVGVDEAHGDGDRAVVRGPHHDVAVETVGELLPADSDSRQVDAQALTSEALPAPLGVLRPVLGAGSVLRGSFGRLLALLLA